MVWTQHSSGSVVLSELTRKMLGEVQREKWKKKKRTKSFKKSDNWRRWNWVCSRGAARCPKRLVRCRRVFLQLYKPPPYPFIKDRKTSRGQEEKTKIKWNVFLRTFAESQFIGRKNVQSGQVCAPNQSQHWQATTTPGTPPAPAATGAHALAGDSWVLEAPFPFYPPEPSPIVPLIALLTYHALWLF